MQCPQVQRREKESGQTVGRQPTPLSVPKMVTNDLACAQPPDVLTRQVVPQAESSQLRVPLLLGLRRPPHACQGMQVLILWIHRNQEDTLTR